MAEQVQGQARRIAIVEDEPAIAQNLRDAFVRHGYQVSLFGDRAQAQAAFSSRLPDLAVIDVTPDGLRVRDMIDGMTLKELQARTGAPLRAD